MGRAIHLAGIFVDIPREQPMDVLRRLLRDAQQRGPCVRDGGAVALLAHLQGLTADGDVSDAEQPIPELGLVHVHPLELPGYSPTVVPAEGDLAGHAIVHGHEYAEARVHESVQPAHLAHEAKLRVEGQTLQAQAEHTVELEVRERLGGHLRGKDDAEPRTVGTGNSHRGAVLRNLVDGRRAGRRVQREASGLAGELADDIAGAESYGDLVPLLRVGRDEVTVVIDVDGRRRGSPIVAPVQAAWLALALLRWNDEVPRACVEHHGERLRRRADIYVAEVCRLVHHGTAVPHDRDVLLVQRNRQQLTGRPGVSVDLPSGEGVRGPRRPKGREAEHGGGRGVKGRHRSRAVSGKPSGSISALA
mmetsp:Transcript_60107/g.173345  ORF Transcript_60107/g.173345 Transcript_60107/m.173345 type:complete len:361 (+) Transcript_60107:469-1551(+)